VSCLSLFFLNPLSETSRSPTRTRACPTLSPPVFLFSLRRSRMKFRRPCSSRRYLIRRVATSSRPSPLAVEPPQLVISVFERNTSPPFFFFVLNDVQMVHVHEVPIPASRLCPCLSSPNSGWQQLQVASVFPPDPLFVQASVPFDRDYPQPVPTSLSILTPRARFLFDRAP